MEDSEEGAKQGSGGQGLPAEPLFFPLSQASAPGSLPGSDPIPLNGTLTRALGVFLFVSFGVLFSPVLLRYN